MEFLQVLRCWNVTEFIYTRGHIPQQFELSSSNNLQVYTYRCVCVCVCKFPHLETLSISIYLIIKCKLDWNSSFL